MLINLVGPAYRPSFKSPDNEISEFDMPSFGTELDPINLRIYIWVLRRFKVCCCVSSGCCFIIKYVISTALKPFAPI